MTALDPGRQLLSPVLRALSTAEEEGRITSRVAENRRRWATEHADGNGVVAVPRGWSVMDPPGTYGSDDATWSVAPREVTGRTSGSEGAVLRHAGVAVSVVGVVSVAWTSASPDAFSVGEVAWGEFLTGAVEAVVYGGLLWGVGTIVGQLDVLLRRS